MCCIIEPWFKKFLGGYLLCCSFVLLLVCGRLFLLCRFGWLFRLLLRSVLFGLLVWLCALFCSSAFLVLRAVQLVVVLFGVTVARSVSLAVGVVFLLVRLLVFVVLALFGLFVPLLFAVILVLFCSSGCGFLPHPFNFSLAFFLLRLSALLPLWGVCRAYRRGHPTT